MANNRNKRHIQILNILSQVPISSTQQLAEHTHVSNETIRKDLDALSAEGKIIKVHGGVAAVNSEAEHEIPFMQRASKNIDLKSRIVKKAVEIIEEEDTILLESCTTNLELAKELVKRSGLLETLIIITNSFKIASIFESGNKCKSMFFLGGWVHPKQFSTLSIKTNSMLREFHLSKAFLSGAALSNQQILTGYYEDDVDFQKNAISAAHEIILMVDSSKFGQNAIFSVAHISEFDFLITDKLLSPETISELHEKGVKYIKA